MNSYDWVNRAVNFVVDYPQKRFLAEDVREWAYENGLPKPDNDRVWGVVIKLAVKDNIIRRIGFRLVNNPNAHKTPASYWEKV